MSAILFLVTSCLLYADPPLNSCRVCHSDAASAYKKSIHAERGIDCTYCHGGDSTNLTLSAMSKSSGFKGKIKRPTIPALCANCHSNSRMMLQYGNFFDQFNIYKWSQHGILLQKGEDRVAVCTDCHGVHEIRRVTDPASTAYWKNIPLTCAKCHSDKDYMKDFKIPVDQYEKYKESVHGVQRLEKGDMHSPGCPDCHGSHGAAPPGVKEVHNVCGRCHVLQRRYFEMSPHSRVLISKKMKECITCHGTHDIKPVSTELFVKKTENGKSCIQCHSDDTEGYKVAERIAQVFSRVEETISNAVRLTEQARAKGFDIDDENLKIEEARSRLNELRPITHTLSLQQIEEGAESAEMLAKDAIEMVNAKMIEWRDRRVTLSLNVLIFLSCMILLYILRRRFIKDGTKTVDQ